jgi:hypothetical protein
MTADEEIDLLKVMNRTTERLLKAEADIAALKALLVFQNLVTGDDLDYWLKRATFHQDRLLGRVPQEDQAEVGDELLQKFQGPVQ